jgi:CBS domain-containing protein
MTIGRMVKNLDLKVRTIKPNARVHVAIASLARDDTSALVVTMDGHRVLGILSSSDIVKHINEYGALLKHLRVSHLMTHDVIFCDVTEDVRRLEQLMLEHHVRHIPITDQGLLCAVVNILDLVRYRMQSAEKEATQLRHYVAGVV